MAADPHDPAAMPIDLLIALAAATAPAPPLTVPALAKLKVNAVVGTNEPDVEAFTQPAVVTGNGRDPAILVTLDTRAIA